MCLTGWDCRRAGYNNNHFIINVNIGYSLAKAIQKYQQELTAETPQRQQLQLKIIDLPSKNRKLRASGFLLIAAHSPVYQHHPPAHPPRK